MAFDPDEYLNETGTSSTATAEFDPDAYLKETEEQEAPFDPDAYLAETETPEQPAQPQAPVGTSIGAEIAAIPQALKQAVGQPLEAMGETATVLGAPSVGAALRGAIEEPQGYIPASQRLVQPQEGEFQIAGFAPQYIPRAAVEQAGQIAGAIATSAIGRAVGGLAGSALGPKGTVAGAVAGQFLGPALFEMGQIVGPAARERAANQGREEPNTDDLAWAWGTAAGSGALNAIGAKYLPNGDKLASSLGRRIAESWAAESTTEGAQELLQQVGQTFLTEQGLELKPKEAIGAALVAGPAAAGATVIAAPFTPTPEAKAVAAADTKVAAEQAAPVAPETAQVVSEQANQVIAQAQSEETAETPDERVARLQREAQEAAGEIELEEEPPVAGLPPVEPTPPVTPTPEAAVAPVEPVVAAEGARPATPEIEAIEGESELRKFVRENAETIEDFELVDITRGEGDADAKELASSLISERAKQRLKTRIDEGKTALLTQTPEGDVFANSGNDEAFNVKLDLLPEERRALSAANADREFAETTEEVANANAAIQEAVRPAVDRAVSVPVEGAVEPAVTEVAPARNLADLEVRPPTDNVQQVAAANDLTVGRADVNVPAQELESTVNLSDPKERERVDNLKEQISSEGGFISRVIVDGQNNVVEGQHRVQAMKELGYDQIPAVQLKSAEDFIPDSNALDKVMQDAGLTASDNRTQMRQLIAEIISDEKGDVTQLREYEAPAGFETAWNAATEEVIRQNAVPEAAPAAVEPTTVATPPVTPQLEPLRRVARAEQTEEDVAGLVDSGFVEVYNGQPVITQAGLDALPEAERPRLTPEARKIQIDTRTSEAAAEAISKNLRIGVDQVPVDVRMPAGWTLEGDIYVPPQPQAVTKPEQAVTPPTLKTKYTDNNLEAVSLPRASGQSNQARQALEAIAKGSSPYAQLAQEIINAANTNPEISFAISNSKFTRSTPQQDRGRFRGRSFYEPAYRTISMNPKQAGDTRIALHEIIHAIISHKLPNKISSTKLKGKKYKKALDEAATDQTLPKPLRDIIRGYVIAVEKMGAGETLWGSGPDAGVTSQTLNVSTKYLGAPIGAQTKAQREGGRSYRINKKSNVQKLLRYLKENGITEVDVKRGFYGRGGRAHYDVIIANSDLEKIAVEKKQQGKHPSYYGNKGYDPTNNSLTWNIKNKIFPVANDPDAVVEYGFEYGLGNIDEFLSEALSNPEFQKALNEIEMEGGKTVWQTIIDAIARILGIEVKAGSVLDVISRSAFELATEGDLLLAGGRAPTPAPTPEVREARREPAITPQRFYSQLQRTVEAKMPNVSSPEQLKAIIDPTRGSGVKPEEVKWSGITEAIDRIASENNGRVPKEEILKYLRNEGAVKFEEVTLARKKVPYTGGEIKKSKDGKYYTVSFLGYDSVYTKLEDAQSDLQKMREGASRTQDDTKYSQYQLPDGENYREVVLTIPTESAEELSQKMRDLSRERRGIQESGRMLTREESNRITEIDEETRSLEEKIESAKSKYKSPHFENIPNYVAHMRLNDRKDADGNEGTFIEEIQSDLHQKAREVGYKDESIVGQNFVSWLKSNKKELSEQEIETQFKTRIGEEVQQWLKDQEVAAKNASAVPDAPFRKDWPIQMFKRALEQAVVSGKDWIGWTTGETQASRYDLSKRISRVGFEPDDVMDFSVGELYAYDLNNKLALRETNVTPDKLSDYIGKEAAEKMLQQIERIKYDRSQWSVEPDPDEAGKFVIYDPNGDFLFGTGGEVLSFGSQKTAEQYVDELVAKDNKAELSGLDLKVGGEGMVGFYDNILPKEIAKYVKKWGATVGKGSIGGEAKIEKRGSSWYVTLSSGERQAFSDEDGARQYAEKANQEATPIWRVNITPEMRRIIQEEGQAVFLRRLRGEPMVGMEQSAVEARLQELGFPKGGIIRVVNEPDADFEGRTIILDGKVTGIELNAAAMRDNATIDRVLNHEFAESANADGALNRLVERLTPKEKKEINDTITRLRYEERARTAEEAARAIETLAEAWKGRGFFTRAVARVEAWASKLGFKLTRRAAEYIAARNLADINAGFRTAYNQFISVRGEVREGRAEDQAVVDADMGRRSQTELTPQEIDQLEKGEKIRVYRAMQIIDGKLYPPMSALVGGKLRKPTEIGAWEKAEERPDLLDKKGKFVLQKGNKTTVPAAYNPYFHTSSSPLNDQFSSAYKRDNLVTVEVEIPASELTSGYKAEGAKDAVGEVRWNAGPVSSKLPADKKRRVFLSRYAKVVRIVPDSEVAEVISGLLEGTNLSVPENTVTPSLRSELEKRGVAVTPRPARGQEIRESRREPEAIPTFTEGTPEAATLKEMEASMAKVDAASEAKGGKPETYKISEIASVWMDSGLDERALQDAIVEYTNLTPANAQKVAKAIAKQYGLQKQIAEAAAPLAEIAPEPEGAARKTAAQRLIEQTTGVRKAIVKVTGSEKALLNKQIQLKAREARETRKARKEAAADLVQTITDYVKETGIRGPINSRQSMSLAKKALKLDVNNDKAVDRFIIYAEKVIENANYDRDVRDAKGLIKRAKTIAKAKTTAAPQATVLNAIANINPSMIDNPFEFNVLVERYLMGFLPVTSKRYSVLPDADVTAQLEVYESQVNARLDELNRAEVERFLAAQADFAERRGMTVDEAMALLNSNDDIAPEVEGMEIEKQQVINGLLNNLAQASQKTLMGYDDSANDAYQKKIISFMKRVNVENITADEKKRYIRFANNIIANGQTFGAEQFEAIALGQERAIKASKDKRLADKFGAWIGKFTQDIAGENLKKVASVTQSQVDTLKNIFGRENLGVISTVLGLSDLDIAQTEASNVKEELANDVSDFYGEQRKKYGSSATSVETKGYAGLAAYLIQVKGNETQENSIAYRRRLVEENIQELRKSERQKDQNEASLKDRILGELTGTTNAEILTNLKEINPSAYEQLVWWKDVVFPKYKDFLKAHIENFRNQANSYDNPDYLAIAYLFGDTFDLNSELETSQYDDSISLRVKQAANSIKRKDHPTLPKSKSGKIANIDINFGVNQYNALVDQIERAYTAPKWEAIYAFTRTPEFEGIMGGRRNAEFVKKMLGDIKSARSRHGTNDIENRIMSGFVAMARRMSSQAVMGGFSQAIVQPGDQFLKLISTTGRYDLIGKNMLEFKNGEKLMSKFPISRRGDVQAGTQFASTFVELGRRVEASVTGRKWAQFRETMKRVGELWMGPLRISDVYMARVAWMTYYESYLNKRKIYVDDWAKEADLVETDDTRKEAAAQAESLVDLYMGASDPTKMASLSRQSNNGWREFAKLKFLPLNSFALQQKSVLISDIRDLALRTGDKKAALAAIMGNLAGMASFHYLRIFIVGGMVYPLAQAMLKGIFGVDMDEPDEEKQKEELETKWRKFYARMMGNIFAGGAGQLIENVAVIDAFNYASYLFQGSVNPDSLLNEKGEVMSFGQYEKKMSPLYRYRAFDKSEYSFGLADVITEQAQRTTTETAKLLNEEEMSRYTGDEQAYAYFATVMEWLYFFRLMDTDVTRIVRDLKRQMDKQVEERESEIRAIRSGR